MESLLTIAGCTKLDETRVYAAWYVAESHLEAKIAELPYTAAPLVVSISRQEQPPRWQAKAALHVPPQTLAAESASDGMRQAVDEMAGRLAGQIDQWQNRPLSLSLRRHGAQAVASLLDRCHVSHNPRAFLWLLGPIVWTLAPYVGRELQLAELEGNWAAAGLEPVEVLDEVMLRAWYSLADRPKHMPLDLWLVRLTDEALRDLILSGKPFGNWQSLEDQTNVPTFEPRSTLRDEWIEQADHLESVQLAELLPGGEGASAWDRLETDGKRAAIALRLGPLDRPVRQALVLTAVEGFSVTEVADFQQRTPQAVSDDIALGKEQIRQQMEKADWFLEQEQMERRSARRR